MTPLFFPLYLSSPRPVVSTELDEIKHQLEETMGRQELQRQMSRVKRESECPSEDGSIPELKRWVEPARLV